MDKRRFLKNLGNATLASTLLPFELGATLTTSPRPYPQMEDEGFWKRIREDYVLKPAYINLENGYYNMIPSPIMNAYLEHIKNVNYEASYYMRTVQFKNKAKVASRLASVVNCPADQLIITRNATESLNMIIGGYPWQKGDEAIFAKQDYGAMRLHFYQMRKRYGMVCKEVSIPNHPKSDDEIVALYEGQINKRTKMIMVCDMVNITGQLLPIKKICKMAHSHGVEVLVDGAHCVGHVQVDIEALQCDYYASSLHKWLSVPLGAGMLYVAKKHIPKIWPLFAEDEMDAHNIRRLNHTGTHPVHTDLAINDAIDYLHMVGLERKEKRLRYLQRYWSEQVRDMDKVVVNTPKEEHRSCAIANVGLTHMAPAKMANMLLEEFKIWTVAIDYENVKGCRITPNIYTTTDELDVLVDAISHLAKRT